MQNLKRERVCGEGATNENALPIHESFSLGEGGRIKRESVD